MIPTLGLSEKTRRVIPHVDFCVNGLMTQTILAVKLVDIILPMSDRAFSFDEMYMS